MVNVRDFLGGTMVLQVSDATTLGDIQRRLGWDLLAFRGKAIQGTQKTLRELHIKPNDTLVMVAPLRGGSFGLCLGPIGAGQCSGTTSASSTNIVNTAIASAYSKIAFSCKPTIDAGNTVTARGVCGCPELGFTNDVECAKYEKSRDQMKAQVCAAVSQSHPNMDSDSLLCLCNLGGGGCNIRIDEKSIVTSQARCTSVSDVQNKLSQDFANNVLDSIKQSMNDVGGLFDSNDQNSVKDVANRIQQSITQQNISDIALQASAANTVTAGCGGVNAGITLYSHFTSILDVLNQNKQVADLSAQVDNTLKTVMQRKDKGLLGFLSGTTGIILIVLCCLAGVAVLYFLYMKRQASQPARSEQPQPQPQPSRRSARNA